MKDQFTGMNITKKCDNKNVTSNFRYFLESNFVGVNRLFVLVYSKEDVVLKDLKLKGITY